MPSGIILPNLYLVYLAGRPLDDGWASGVVPCTENATPAQMQIAGLVELLGSIEQKFASDYTNDFYACPCGTLWPRFVRAKDGASAYKAGP